MSRTARLLAGSSTWSSWGIGQLTSGNITCIRKLSDSKIYVCSTNQNWLANPNNFQNINSALLQQITNLGSYNPTQDTFYAAGQNIVGGFWSRFIEDQANPLTVYGFSTSQPYILKLNIGGAAHIKASGTLPNWNIGFSINNTLPQQYYSGPKMYNRASAVSIFNKYQGCQFTWDAAGGIWILDNMYSYQYQYNY